MGFTMAASLVIRRLRPCPSSHSQVLKSSLEIVNKIHTTSTCYKIKAPQVFQSSNKGMIVAWHPEPEFPYEHTRPIARDVDELAQSESVLKSQLLIDDKLKNRPDGPTTPELTQLLYTSKHYFRRRYLYEKRMQKKFHPKDRDGL